MGKSKNLKIKIQTKTGAKFSSEIEWDKKEQEEIETRILNLRDDQIAALMNLAGLNFKPSDIPNVVSEIKKNGKNSGHLEIIISEADSKENLLWWLGYFENSNK
ncbi:MAG: hypothetical protein UT16_C0012G0011 [Candidatus Azambacteria bacterium GW2011_GWA2_39_10]|uniref:Uncharacterized protein n=1 Tax=Candidatus Azambacteria bacterium GW2011_GWA2_39_10 TaxID=1618611 RepID=A0A0G0LU95_9BACT|nr:MAG: hypothetical protein UT16_C0012G0011 [Candidatus Azambacteria bacterium GW2011_GWA2_39_10]